MEYFPGFTNSRDHSLEAYSPAAVGAAYTYFSHLIYYSQMENNKDILDNLFQNLDHFNPRLVNNIKKSRYPENAKPNWLIDEITNQSIGVNVKNMLLVWIENFDSIFEINLRKLCCIGVVNLWSYLGRPEDLSGSILCLFLEILHDVRGPERHVDQLNQNLIGGPLKDIQTNTQNIQPTEPTRDLIFVQFQNKKAKYLSRQNHNNLTSLNKIKLFELDCIDPIFCVDFVEFLQSIVRDFNFQKGTQDGTFDVDVLKQFDSMSI